MYNDKEEFSLSLSSVTNGLNFSFVSMIVIIYYEYRWPFLPTTLLNTYLPFSSCLVYWSVLSIITTTSNLALFLQFYAHCSCNKGRHPRECRYLDMTQQNGNFFDIFLVFYFLSTAHVFAIIIFYHHSSSLLVFCFL